MSKFKIIFTAVLMLTLCTSMQAQFGKRLGNAIENAAKNATVRKAEQKTDEAVSKTIDKATDPDTYKDDGSGSNDNNANKASKSEENQNQASSKNAAKTPQQGAKAAEMAYAKSDFVPGDEIFFEDDMANEKLGEFPSQWDLESGNAEIASINGEKCISLIGYTIINPLMSEKNYLPDEFTVEFDMYGDAAKQNVECEIGFNDSRVFIPRTYINKGHINLYGQWVKPDDSHGSQTEDRIPAKGNEWNHVSISFNKRACKYYINGIRYLNIPNMKKPNSLWFWCREGNYYIKNVRIARGAVPLYDRMMSDGKFITYGITFDVGKSIIKPESMGEITRIVTLLKENPTFKFSVEGHTDSTGNAASNQTLSEARSQAIVDKLIEMGIAADRLKSAGKGQNNPIADNGTDEGRAKNRRVEFVKI